MPAGEIENIFENPSDFVYMLNQASGGPADFSQTAGHLPHQLSYVTHSGEGEGLLFYGNIILPFIDRFPKGHRAVPHYDHKITGIKGGKAIMTAQKMKHNPRLFLQRAMEIQRRQLLLAMADAVSECRTAERMAAELNGDGETGLLRLAEIWCCLSPGTGGRIMEGRGAELLADVLAQVYACLILRPLHTPAGMGLYMELLYMMEALMLGEWFE